MINKKIEEILDDLQTTFLVFFCEIFLSIIGSAFISKYFYTYLIVAFYNFICGIVTCSKKFKKLLKK